MSRVLWIEQVYDPDVERSYPIVSPERAFEALGGSDAPEVVVIGPSLSKPVRLASKLAAAAPELWVLIACRPEQEAALRRALAFDPLVGRGRGTSQVVGDGRVDEAVERALAEIAKRRRHQEALRAAQASLQRATPLERAPSPASYAATMWESSPVGVLAVGPGSGRVLSANGVAARLLRIEALDLIGRPIQEVLPPLDEQMWGALIADDERVVDHRVEWEEPGGERRCLEVRAAGMERPGSPGRGEAMLVFLRDITDQARSEALQRDLVEAERQARLHAERAGRAREEIVAMVSHDLRSPLQTVTTAVHLLTEELGARGAGEGGEGGDDDDDFVAEALQAAGNATRYMRRLIEDLLDVTRMESGRLDLTYTDLRLDEVVDEAFEVVEGAALGAGIGLRAEVPAALPGICGDRTRVVQVLQNLLGNAIKFSDPGDEVVVSAAPTEGGVRLSVRDQGPGIAEEAQPHLFSRFWQAGERKESGVGLGLAIVRGIVEAHGGRVWVESTPGQGASFHVELPREPAHRQDDA